MSDETFVSAASRRLKLRMRPDLDVQQLRFRREPYWSVKDPISLRYYQLRGSEFRILQLLDGTRSLQQVQETLQEEIAPQRIDVAQLQGFVGRLHREGLLLSEASGQGIQLRERELKQRRLRWATSWMQLLSLQFSGVDPDRFLTWLAARLRWMFTPAALVIYLLVIVAAGVLAAVEFDTLRSRLPSFQEFFYGRNLLALAVAIALSKVVHELAHGATCRHFGARCHELGVMLLCFTPCLYCNVTDAWMLPGKWQRIAVSAAGMLSDLLLASLAMFVWWFAEPGLLSALCLNMMFVGAVSSLLFNGNPLLKYDAYYMLADAIEVPNLQEQSRRVVGSAVSEWLLDTDLFPGPPPPQGMQLPLAAYALASLVYRVLVLFGIVWMLESWAEPLGLDALVNLVTVIVVCGLVAQPVMVLWATLRDPARRWKVHWGRFLVRTSLIAVVVAGVLSVPLPYSVSVPALIQARNSTAVYVTAPGRLLECVPLGSEVAAGDTLARLENLQLTLEFQQISGRLAEQVRHVENLERRRVDDPEAGVELPTALEILADLRVQHRQQQKDLAALTIAAPISGTVLAPPRRSGKEEDSSVTGWSGYPQDERNLDCFLARGTWLCSLGDAAQQEAVLVIGQGEVPWVEEGQQVTLTFPETPWRELSGTIEHLARGHLEQAPPQLVAAGELAAHETGTSAGVVPQEKSYQALVTLAQPDAGLLIGSAGRAKISAAPQSLGQRLWRYLRKTFGFRTVAAF